MQSFAMEENYEDVFRQPIDLLFLLLTNKLGKSKNE